MWPCNIRDGNGMIQFRHQEISDCMCRCEEMIMISNLR
jgi:hypothetical protein